MMGKIVEHFITGLQQDCEQLREQRDLSVFDSEARKKKEVKLYQASHRESEEREEVEYQLSEKLHLPPLLVPADPGAGEEE